MDWAKAKTILIIVFVIVNIFLSYQLINMRKNDYIVLEQSTIDDTINYLKKDNIIVNAELPKSFKNIDPLTVLAKEYDSELLKTLFFQENKASESEYMNTLTIKQDQTTIRITNAYELHYKNEAIESDADSSGYEEAVKEFLQKLELNNDEKYIKTNKIENGYRKIVYGQSHKGSFIDGAYIELLVNRKGVREAKIYWFDYKEPINSEVRVKAPIFAMLKVGKYYKESKADTNINSVELGYYYSKQTNARPEDPSSQLNIAIPVWRITTEDRILFVNAYNESIEKITDQAGLVVYSEDI